MVKGYGIACIDVDDLEPYRKCVAANAKPLAANGARFPVRAGHFETL